MPLAPFDSPFAFPLTALHRHVFDAGGERVDCGSAILVTTSPAQNGAGSTPENEDDGLTIAQAEQFLAGGPLTLRWIAPSPSPRGTEQVYVYCWVTIGD